MILQSSDAVRHVARHRRLHHRVAFGYFLALGFHVGVRAVQLANLATALRLDAQMLGFAGTVAAASGIVTLLVGGYVADRLGRRLVLGIGFAGTAASFIWQARIHSLSGLMGSFVLYGLCCSFIDLGANAIGSDYEHCHGVGAMTGLHAGFSLGAMLGALATGVALWCGVGFRTVYLGLAAVLAAVAVGSAVAPLPSRTAEPGHRHRRLGLAGLRIPAVGFAIALITVTFFGDGALENFLAVYLHTTLASGPLLIGVGIGSYHLASLTGRLLASRVLSRWQERTTITAAGLLAAAGLAISVTAPSSGVAIAGLLLVGLAIAPVVPSALSLAGRSAPGQSAQAVAAATAAGYSAFIISPIVVGAIANRTSLRMGLALLITTALADAALASRWPTPDKSPSQS
ncbi:MAG: MFS transporter [Streptomycetaceae bacterium]|nr:MFS transporter [Streptomycetaceae bacterium]